MQETLGNLFAGLAIQMQRPFDVDDWIEFDDDPKHIGRVLEINWRATKVMTLDDVEIIVPNGTLAKAPIINFTKPTPTSRRSIYVQAPPDVAPHVVREAILSALPEADGVLERARARRSYRASSRAATSSTGFATTPTVRQARRRRRPRPRAHLVRADGAGVTVGVVAQPRRAPPRGLERGAGARRRAGCAAQREEALGAVDFMRVLSEDQRKRLARSTRIASTGRTSPSCGAERRAPRCSSSRAARWSCSATATGPAPWWSRASGPASSSARWRS